MKKALLTIFCTLLLLLLINASAQIQPIKKRLTEIPPGDKYRVEIASSVEKNWKFDRSLIGEQEPIAAVSFKVLPDGRVTDFEFKQPSWNKHFDAEVLNAVIKSIPFKPYPPGINDPWVQIAIRFTSNGL
jgi:TonB family protein